MRLGCTRASLPIVAREELTPTLATSASFGELLRQHRLAAGMTQEGLAERAGLSVHGIQKLESGATHPYRDTAERLIRALQLGEHDEALLKLAARPAPRRHQPHGPPESSLTRSREPDTHQLADLSDELRRSSRRDRAGQAALAGRSLCSRSAAPVAAARRAWPWRWHGNWRANSATASGWSSWRP